jgi:hypothetical protein
MKFHALAISALLFIPLAPAGAQQQDGRAEAAQKIFNWCMRLDSGSPSECGCVAGFYAGVTQDDEFEMVGAIVDFITPEGGISDNEAMTAAILAKKEAMQMNDTRLDEIVETFLTFDQLGEKADGVCVPVENAANASPHTTAEQ